MLETETSWKDADLIGVFNQRSDSREVACRHGDDVLQTLVSCSRVIQRRPSPPWSNPPWLTHLRQATCNLFLSSSSQVTTYDGDETEEDVI